MNQMAEDDQREVQGKLRIIQQAERIGHVVKACCYLGSGPNGSCGIWREKAAINEQEFDLHS